MMSRQFTEYTDTLAQCMINYQFIEESLKFCLYRCQAIIKFRLWGILPYEVQMKSIDNAALGRLIEQYQPLTKNETLIKKLRSIKEHRNFCAHQGYLLTDYESSDQKFLEKKRNELSAFLSEAQSCMKILKEEMEKVDQLVNEVYAKLRTEQATPADVAVAPPLS